MIFRILVNVAGVVTLSKALAGAGTASSSADKPMGLRTAHSTSRERLSHSIIISVDGTVAYHSSPTKPFHIRQFWAWKTGHMVMVATCHSLLDSAHKWHTQAPKSMKLKNWCNPPRTAKGKDLDQYIDIVTYSQHKSRWDLPPESRARRKCDYSHPFTT